MDRSTLDRLSARMETYGDLLDGLPADALVASLPVPSNPIGSQLWCVVGARESYARGIAAGEWSGFSCSLTGEDARRESAVRDALGSSAAAVRAALEGADGWTTKREELVLDLLEHEAQHQGQLIRYIYGLGYSFPDSWKQRWALD